MKLHKIEVVAVVLVYRNADDLINCIESYQKSIQSCKIIVVNAFYDNDSFNIIKRIANDYNCDFLNIENKGYSYGNNYGIAYARQNYEYDFLIVSNPDIEIKAFDTVSLETDSITAPCIIAKSGRKQNPMVIKRNRISDYLIYKGFKSDIQNLIILGLGLNKMSRIFFEKVIYRHKNNYQIYQPHGSFIIFGREVINALDPVFDENMFLFAEEGVLAIKAKEKNIRVVYNESIVINHKEDGSMSLSDLKMSDELKKANVYYYEKYCKTNK